MNSSLSNQKVLVTGATGFVGGHLARHLVQLGATVRCLVRSTSNSSSLQALRSLGVELFEGDITNRTQVFNACASQDYVMHTAAVYREAKFADDYYFQVNLEGTRHVLDGSKEHGIKRMIHTSTTGVHSHIPNPPADETEPYNPTDVYQVSKTEAEKLCRSRFENGQQPGVILRPAMIWGEGDRRILKLFRGIARRRLPIIGTGRTWTHWIYVQDLVRAYILAALSPQANGRIYLIAGRRPMPLYLVFETIAKIAGVKPLPFKIPAWPIQITGTIVEAFCRPLGIEPPLHRRRADFFVKNRCFDTSRARLELGFEAAQDFEAEARLIFEWYRAHNWL